MTSQAHSIPAVKPTQNLDPGPTIKSGRLRPQSTFATFSRHARCNANAFASVIVCRGHAALHDDDDEHTKFVKTGNSAADAQATKAKSRVLQPPDSVLAVYWPQPVPV